MFPEKAEKRRIGAEAGNFSDFHDGHLFVVDQQVLRLPQPPGVDEFGDSLPVGAVADGFSQILAVRAQSNAEYFPVELGIPVQLVPVHQQLEIPEQSLFFSELRLRDMAVSSPSFSASYTNLVKENPTPIDQVSLTHQSLPSS